MDNNYIRKIIKEELQRIYEVSDYFYGMKSDGTSVKISYLNFTINLSNILKRQDIDLESLVLQKDWQAINKYLESALSELSSIPTLKSDFKTGKQVRTHDSKENIISKIRMYLNAYYSPTKIEKRRKEKDGK